MATLEPVYYGSVNGLSGSDLQETIDKISADCRAQGVAATVHLPAGQYRLDETLFLPRGDLNGIGGVTLVGDGPLATQIIANPTSWAAPDDDYPEGYPVLETRPYDPDTTTGNHSYRAWGMGISGIGVQTTRVQPSVCYLHRQWRPDLQTTTSSWFEKSQLSFRNCWFRGYNDYQQYGIRIHGNTHALVVDACQFDCGIADSDLDEYFDFVGIKCDDGTGGTWDQDTFNDVDHAMQCRITNCYTTPRLGGYCSLWYGRMHFGVVENILFGGGAMLQPLMDFRNSSAVRVSSLVSEGRAERPAIRLENCKSMKFSELSLGTPNALTSTNDVVNDIGDAGGDGFEMINCRSIKIENWVAWADLASWSQRGFKKVVMDADTRDCVIDMTLVGGIEQDETIANVITDNGSNNFIRAVNADTGARTTQFNQVAGDTPDIQA